ncbi:hypothetical protein D3C77_635750 [compost metagenome]
MNHLHRKLDIERQKLNLLGNESVQKGILFFENEALQAQSRKVDEIIIQIYKEERAESGEAHTIY